MVLESALDKVIVSSYGALKTPPGMWIPYACSLSAAIPRFPKF